MSVTRTILRVTGLSSTIRIVAGSMAVPSPPRYRPTLFPALQVLGQTLRQDAGVERFGEVTVAPRCKRLLIVALHGVGGHREDHDVPRSGVRLQATGELQPIHPG